MKKNVVLLTPPSHSHRTAEESLGIGYLASVLRRDGHAVTIVDGWLLDLAVEDMVRRVISIGCVDLIGVSCYRSSIEDVRDLVSALRRHLSTTPIVGGGYGPTFHAEEFLRVGCDYVLCGEGEQSIADLLSALERGPSAIASVSGLVFKDAAGTVVRNKKIAPVEHLDELPFPSRDSIRATMALKNPVHISTSRGCMAHCLFCSVIAFDRAMEQSVRWRYRSIRSIVEEVYHLYHEFGAECYKIVDDSFMEHPRDAAWACAFGEELRKRGLKIRFRTQVRADRLTPEIVQALAGAGWFATSVGIENGSASALARMNKSATLEHNLNALALLEQHGIYVQMGMILFDHATTMAELWENFRFLETLHWPVTKGIFTEMFAAEGTPFTRIVKGLSGISVAEHGNYQYRRESPPVEVVYRALKIWHRSHSVAYDHAINPISAPKVLPGEGYREYQGICALLYRQDLAFFKEALTFAECPTGTIDDFVSGQIGASAPFYDRMQRSLSSLDAKYGLSYIATPNKFL